MSNSHQMQSNFIMEISRLPDVVVNLQTVEIPALTLSERLIIARPTDFSRPGEKLIFDKLNLTFLVDDKVNNFTEIQDWMWECVNPNKGTMGKESNLVSDISIALLDKHKKVVRRYRFHDCFPIMVGPLMLANTGLENAPIVCPMTISFSHYHDEASEVQDVQLKPL